MLAHSDIQRSLTRMTIDLHRAMDKRRSAANDYGIAEREFQAQYDFSGSIGTLPVEASIEIPFTINFVGDPGNQRDSTLDRPQARLAAELVFGPSGVVPYHYVKEWVRDADFNFTGAIVVVGIHYPALALVSTQPTSMAFKGVLHASFQGWGAPWDPDGPFDAGGIFDDQGLT